MLINVYTNPEGNAILLTWLYLKFPKKKTIFHLFGLCLQMFMENLRTTHLAVIAFMVRDIMVLNGIIIFTLGGIIKIMLYLKMCH